MRQKTFYFLSGLPRSGSTVLAAILNQNPDVYVTPTSPLLDYLLANQQAWHTTPSVKANPNFDQLTNIVRNVIDACWQHVPQKIIIDKNRGWGKNMPASTILFEKEIKVIATVRDLPSIMASWLVLLKKNPNSNMRNILAQKRQLFTEENMMHEMWENMVKDCMEAIVQLKKDAGNRTLFINYDDLIVNPNNILVQIEKFLNLPTHTYSYTNIESKTQDDDLVAWGLSGMHSIRSTLKKTSLDPRQVLGNKMFEYFSNLEKQYK